MATYYVPSSTKDKCPSITSIYDKKLYLRIKVEHKLNSAGTECTVTAYLQANCEDVTFGNWIPTLNGKTTANGVDTGEGDVQNTWYTFKEISWTETVDGDDGTYSIAVSGSLKSPSGGSFKGKTVSISKSTKNFDDGTVSKKTITYYLHSDDTDKYYVESFTPNTSYTLTVSRPDNEITGTNTYSCSITGGDGGNYDGSGRTTTETTLNEFSGWKTKNGTHIYQCGDTVNFQLNTTFYAQWTEKETYDDFTWPYKSDFSHDSKSETFTITGDGNGGTNKASNATKTTPYDISSSLTSNFGYTYYYGDTDHLTKDEDGNTVYPTWTEGTPKYANNTIGNLGSTSRDDATKIGYIISFEGLSSQVNQDLSCSYAFDGWYDSADGGNKYDDSTSFTEATTVYAHWNETKKPNAVQLPDPTARPGYEFLGWMTSEGKILTGDDFADMLPTVEGEGITLTASWKAKGLVRICVGGEYKQALCYVYHEGQYHQAMPYVYTNGKYRLGG